ncbi:MAG: M28 family peptidase [Bacteroidales bacterium]|nr:M28 family peptidase [Bacteroidales bacterium]
MRKHLIRAFIVAMAVACFGITTATSQKPQPYLQVEDLPDILAFLPPPPAEDSPVFQADKAIHDWALTQGSGERAQRAIREGTTDVDTMALYFSGAFGKKLSKETTPLTMYLLERSIRTFRLAATNPKKVYMRPRPFVYYNEGTLIPEDEEDDRHSGSYPSGHTSRGWGMALVLAQLNPERQDTLMAFGYEWGQSRVIANYHWQSDVDAARLMTSATFARLQACEEYRKDLAAAIDELATTEWPVRENDEQLLREWINTIASDEFGGRKPMTAYEEKTVNYLAGQLEELGLEPAFNGSWFQPFEMIAVTAKPQGSKLAVRGKRKAELRYPDDLVVWTARATDRVELPKAEYVFCGFGIHAPEYGWDDYAGIDVKGKIVVAMVNDPGFYDNTLFRGLNMTYYGRWLYKFEEARRQGAAGCLVLHNTEAASYGWHVCVNGHMEDNLALYDPTTRNADELAIKGWLHEDGARKLFNAAGMDMDAALAAAKKPGFKSFSLKVKGDVKMAVSYDIQQTRNVGAILRGTDQPEEVVVMNAHWDHLGIGTPDERGDSIYNGAADNASGMAGALLAAKKFKEQSQAPRRTVLFLFPSSEESGLFGSEYYCSHPIAPMEKTIACLNFESIGPAELTRDIVILGGGESALDRYYEAAAAAQGRYIFYDDDNSDGWFFRSDHYNFVKKGVPAVVVENGQHPVDLGRPNKYPMPVWYHKPSDEYRNDWDLSGTLSNINLIFSVGLSLSNAEEVLVE